MSNSEPPNEPKFAHYRYQRLDTDSAEGALPQYHSEGMFINTPPIYDPFDTTIAKVLMFLLFTGLVFIPIHYF